MFLENLRAVAAVSFTLQSVVDDAEWVAVTVVTTTLYVEVESERLAAVALCTLHVLRADTRTLRTNRHYECV